MNDRHEKRRATRHIVTQLHKRAVRAFTVRSPLPDVLLCLLSALAVSACGGSGSASNDRDAQEAYERGLALQERGLLPRAGDAYHDAIRLDPLFAEAYARRGYIFYRHDNQVRAMADLNAAIKIDPDLALAYNYRGLVYSATKDVDNAVLNFTRSVELEPTLSEAYYNRALANLEAQRVDAVLADLSKVITLEPLSPKYYVERAQVHLMLGDPESAAHDLEQVLAVSQDDAYVLPARRLLSAVRQGRQP